MKRCAIAISAVLAAACGDSSSSDADAGESSSSSSGDTSSSSGSSSGSDSGVCRIASLGWNPGTVAKSVSRGAGNVAWTDLPNGIQEDDTFAKVVLAAGQESEEIQITGFGFEIPATSVLQGVEVQLKRQAPDGGIVDGQIYLLVPNKIGRGKFISTGWPKSIVGTHHYADPADKWGMNDLATSDVTQAAFGVALWVKRAEGAEPASATALVDSIRVRVAYCL